VEHHETVLLTRRWGRDLVEFRRRFARFALLFFYSPTGEVCGIRLGFSEVLAGSWTACVQRLDQVMNVSSSDGFCIIGQRHTARR
jgi:hypothetical protein